MKASQSIVLIASGLFAIFTISLITLFIGYAQWWDGQHDLLFKIGWSGMVFFFVQGLEPWIRHFQHLGFDVLLNEHRILTRDQGTPLIGGGTDYDAEFSFKEIQCPCLVYMPGRYEITIKELDDSEPSLVWAAQKGCFRKNKGATDEKVHPTVGNHYVDFPCLFLH